MIDAMSGRRPIGIAMLLAAAIGAPAFATPYLPASGQQVLETLARRSDPIEQDLRRLQTELDGKPNDPALAARLAQRYITRGRSASDPRYFGYAQAALAPWWQLVAPPTQVRLLRATLLQSIHQFPAALADLDGVLAAESNNTQAWLTRATVQTVMGDFKGAAISCARVARLADPLLGSSCFGGIGTATGRSVQSERLLEIALRREANAAPDVQLWALTLLAEMAARRADAPLAEVRFKAALALAPGDAYLLGAYADFLLDQKRPTEVLKLLRDHTRIDALLLRRALALQQGAGTVQALGFDVAELGARFGAAMRRGDSVHMREQARFELALRGERKLALALAQRNWAVQKEAADIRIYLEAAIGAHDSAAAKPVLDWVEAYHSDDVAVLRLVRQLKGS